ncbi:MAG TPA: hypothetical protein VGO52_25130 [Hyphomonadaceae bacterium]|nr:hypothetical protein [Hyphomonadaceae bacterium]
MVRRIIAALALAALAPPAHAQTTYGLTCAHIQAVAASIQGDLRDIRGGVLGSTTFEARVNLPSYFNCMLTDMGGPFLACARFVGSEDMGREDYKAQTGLLAACLPEARALPPEAVDSALLKRLEGTRYIQTTPKGLLTIGIILAEDRAQPKVRHQIMIGFRLLPPDTPV